MVIRYIADEGKLLGSISDVISNNGQWLINVTSSDKKSILIPFHEDFIVSIDKSKKIIIMNIPEGLTEINLKIISIGAAFQRKSKSFLSIKLYYY